METLINITPNDGYDFQMEYEPKMLIKNIKEKIREEKGIPIYCQKLFWKGAELLENKKLSDYKVTRVLGEPIMISLINLNHLKVKIRLKYISLRYFLKASDSILELKKKIFEKEKIPIKNMQILRSGKIVNDNILIEEIISDLNYGEISDLKFELKILEKKEIKINIVDGKNIDSIYVDLFDNFTQIENQIHRSFDYRLKFKDRFIDDWKLLFQYNIKNGDNIELIKSEGKIKLLIIDSKYQIEMTVRVHLEQKISELKEYISNFLDKGEIELLYDGMLVNGDETFADSDIPDNSHLLYLGQFRAGCPNFNFSNLKN